MKTSHGRRFAATALLTPQRVREEPEIIFALENCPEWVRSIELVITDADGGKPSEAIIVVGRRHRRTITVNLMALAVLIEMTRYRGVRIVTNSNHAKPRPSVYVKMSFSLASEDLVSVRRILFDAGVGLATKPIWRENDYSPENTRTEADSHAERSARQMAMGHVETAARTHSDNPKAFLANLRDLWVATDKIRDGGDQ